MTAFRDAYREFTGKTVEEALRAARDEFGAGLDELDFEIIDKEVKKAVPDIRLLPGSIVQISGEYICVGCSTSRMWLKGDVAKNCENAECVHPEAGWKMTYELF